MTLDEILELVGPLDDSLPARTARERFRAHLAKSVTTAGALRDDIEVCLRTPSAQHARALQDLVNHCGRLVGFRVEFGRGSTLGLIFTAASCVPNACTYELDQVKNTRR